jgi:hypothetical protein
MAAGSSKQSSRLVGAATIVVAALAVFAIFHMGAKLGETERQAKVEGKRVADLTDRLEVLQAAVEAQRAEGPRTSTIILQAPGAASQATPAAQAPASAPSASGSPGMAPQEMHDSVEASFVSESTDASWSRQAAGTARTSVTARLPAGGRIDAIECRSSMCRVEATLPDEQSYREYAFSRKPHLDSAWQGPSMITRLRTESDGSVVSVSYLGRDGTGPLVRD